MRRSFLASAAASLGAFAALPASAQDAPAAAPPAAAAPSAAETPVAPAAAPSAETSGGLRSAVEGFLGRSLHGSLTTRYRLRRTDDATDQDIDTFLDLRVGDETKDAVSGALFLRASTDLDHAHEGEPGFPFTSLDDTFHGSVRTLLHTAYATLRPVRGPIESLRIGRQQVIGAETFHLDGASATTRPLLESIALRATAFAGIPVHFYEKSASGDVVAGLRVEAEPLSGTRAALEYVRVEDELSVLGADAEEDFAAASLWQRIGENVELHGQFTWLDSPRDARLRATANFPEQDLVLQASVYRLFEDEERLATEFDPYTSVIHELVRYDTADFRVAKGFGEHFDVEAGASVRRLFRDDDETPFNRDVERVYVTPTLSGFPWEATSISVSAESWSGDGERIKTWTLDVSHRFPGNVRLSIGSDYSLYAFGPVASDERSHVRTAYLRLRFPLTDSLTADIRTTWEKDDVETFHVFSLSLVLAF